MPAEIQRDFEDSVHNFGRLVHRIAADQWGNDTPCSDWDVRALVNHLVNEALWVKPLLDGMTIAEVGDRFALLDFDDRPVAVVETTEVRILAAGDVDLEFARDEGEGFQTVEDWRRAHERFWAEHDIDDGTLIVAERFRLVARLT